MKKLIATIFCSFFLAISGWSQEDVGQAKSWMQEQEYHKALPVFISCYEADTNRLDCANLAGSAAMKLGNLVAAKKYFHSLEEDSYYYKNACIQLATIYDQQGNIPKAIKYNRRLKDSFPDNALYYRKLGNLFLLSALPLEALTHFTEALERNPHDLLTIKSLSELLIGMDQLEAADSLLRTGLQIDSSYIGLSLLLARIYYKKKAYDSTVQVLMELTGRLDFNSYYNKMLGYSLIQIDSLEKSIPYLQKSLNNESDPEFSFYYLGTAYDKLGDPESALTYYRKAVESGISPGVSIYYKLIARLEKKVGNMSAAIKAYEWSYRLKPDAEILFYLAMATDGYYKDKSIAIRYYERYLASDQKDEKYIEYSKDRVRKLKEWRHLQAKNNK